MPNFFLTLFVFLFTSFISIPEVKAAEPVLKEGYAKHPNISPKVWKELTPYFLPTDHPAKKKLDAIFQTRVTLNEDTLREAGFKSPFQRPFSHIVASKHPKLKGVLVKLYPDSYDLPQEWIKLVDRIKGAQAIKDCIKKHQYEDLFKVPNKWIYPLPVDPAPPSQYYQKYFILVVEDMEILKREYNYLWWQSNLMTHDRVEAIFTIIKEVGLDDSVYAFNIPFCAEDEKLAFIDTEMHHRWPIDYTKLYKYLSEEMQEYFQALVISNP